MVLIKESTLSVVNIEQRDELSDGRKMPSKAQQEELLSRELRTFKVFITKLRRVKNDPTR